MIDFKKQKKEYRKKDFLHSRNVLYFLTLLFVFLLSSFYKLYQPIKFFGIPETDTWDFAVKSDIIANAGYVSPNASGIFAVFNAALQLILGIPQEYIALFGGQLTFLVPLLFLMIARRASPHFFVHFVALFIGAFFGLNRTVLYSPETFSYIFISAVVYLSGLFYFSRKKFPIIILLLLTAWIHMLIHQSGIVTFVVIGLFFFINIIYYRHALKKYFFSMLKNRLQLFINLLALAMAVYFVFGKLDFFSPLWTQLVFYLGGTAKRVDPLAYGGIIIKPFSELTKDPILSLFLILIVITIKNFSSLRKDKAWVFFGSFFFFFIYFSIIYLLPRVGFEVPHIVRFYIWLQLGVMMSLIVFLSLIVDYIRTPVLITFATLLFIWLIPVTPEINIQFSGTTETLASLREIREEEKIALGSFVFTQWYHSPSASYGLRNHLHNDLIIVQMTDWSLNASDPEIFQKYLFLEEARLEDDGEDRSAYLLLSKYLIDFSQTKKASVWTQARSNANIDIDRLKQFSFLDIQYEDKNMILFKIVN